MAKYDFLEIDDELHKGLPELTKDEFAQLEKNIVQDGGPTDPIIVWGAIIVDGRNRWKICKNHGLEFKVECKNFADNDECRDWIINRSLGRRNLTPTQRTMLIGELYINRRKAAQLPVANCEGGQNVPEANNHPIAATIGAEHGINEKTVRRAAEFVESLAKLSTPVREAIESQEVKATHAQVKQLAEMPALDQKAAVNAVKKGQVKKLKDALPAPAKKKGGKKGDTATETPEPDTRARWEQLGDPYSEAVTALNKIIRELGAISEDERTGAHLNAVWTRLKTSLSESKSCIRQNAPAAECPKCKGKGCSTCRNTGFLTKLTVDGLEKASKA